MQPVFLDNKNNMSSKTLESFISNNNQRELQTLDSQLSNSCNTRYDNWCSSLYLVCAKLSQIIGWS